MIVWVNEASKLANNVLFQSFAMNILLICQPIREFAKVDLSIYFELLKKNLSRNYHSPILFIV